jgi:hypothetical protein
MSRRLQAKFEKYKKFVSIGVVLWVLFVIIYRMVDFKLDDKRSYELCKEDQNKEFSGIIKKAYFDSNNKGLFTIIIETTNHIDTITDLYIEEIGLINIGDSIIKKKNIKEYYLFDLVDKSKVDTIRIKFDCEEYLNF